MASTPGDAAAFEAAIIHACAEHERSHWRENGYRRCLVIDGFFVKFDSYQSLYPEFETQKYVFQCAKSNMSAPRVPEVIQFFHRDDQMAYMVMENIKFTPTPVPDLSQRVALAIQWLRDLPTPPPDRVRIGPLGSGRARHHLFKNYKAPLSFSSIQAIERYLNKAITRLPSRSAPVALVSLCNERLVFTQSDMDESNFGVDVEGRTCLFDFGAVGLLPESFASYTMSSSVQFTAAVAQHLGWPSSSNLHTMSKISRLLWILSNPTLGLDDNGNPRIA
ncbi:uncharacterized protein LAESUDRAFT_761275 [Laetiporus sulphureus 93-53]|uniref:Aminoglycoside phosphotransferase domain-containing protein n=1 Tax=Laetiporus sulphureus 93-53 TaxID=1314785 RepID=A0A165D4Z3_9APHY|nr:uncharacterized protein LAESUDRAFT_761275 [Laetiporus sulphureus 93-53]KZT04162.1 hypothetical protein LAESUDRAFT_761275 [Laetiporus sulphureus 93-53]